MVFGKYDLEMDEGIRDLSEEVQIVKRNASRRFWLSLKIKENMIIQKSMLKWLNDGNANIRSFIE